MDQNKPIDNYSGYLAHDPAKTSAPDQTSHSGYLHLNPKTTKVIAADPNTYSGYLNHDPKPTKSLGDDIKDTEYLHPVARESLADKKVDSPAHKREKVEIPNKPVDMRELRFDSGVADLDQSPSNGTPSPSAAFRPISTNKTYDYADYGVHQYEELPHARPNVMQMSPGSTDSRSSDNHSSAGTTVSMSDVPSDAGDRANIVRSQSQKEEEQRKRYNPLYDAMITNNNALNVYNKVRVTRESMLLTQIRLLRVIVIILVFISCTSLSLSLYLIVSNSTDSTEQNLKKEVSTLEKNLKSLQNRITEVEGVMAGNLSFEHLAQLGQKVLDLESSVTSNLTNLDRQIKVTNNAVTINEDKILSVYQNYTSSLSTMNSTVQDQLDTISKMPGPQGVGNLTACFLQEYSQGSSSSLAETDTKWFPLDADLKTKVVMSAYCSVQYGLYTRMEVSRPISTDYRTVKYRCICTGQTSEDIRYCRIHLWFCPRESFGGS